MSLQLYLSARPEELLAALRPRLAAARAAALSDGGGVPRPVPVLVPSAQLADWLQVRLARELGLSMGFEFLQPRVYFSRHFAAEAALADLSPAYSYWSPERLRWRILPHVDGLAQNLGHDPAHPLASRERFAFAGLLADQFDRYARFRPHWAEAWLAGRPVLASKKGGPNSAALTDEQWQRELWQTLAREPGAPLPPSALLAQLERTAGTAPAPTGPLFVVGTDLVDPLLLRTLQVLARRGQEIGVFLLLPSLGFLGDLSRRDSARQIAATLHRDAAGEPGEVAPSGHPLLGSLGQQAAGTFQLVGEMDPDYAGWPDEPDDPDPGSQTLLQRLQSDIRRQQPPPGRPIGTGAPDLRAPWSSVDRSLRVHCCHSARRELEVLRDELLRAFAELPGLQPEDVLVAVTDFDRYAPLAEGILRAGSPPLPLRLTAIPAREANPVALALLALLRLAPGRHAASELIDLLNLVAVQIRLEVDGEAGTLAQLAGVIRQSGLTHGLDASEREAAGTTGTWREALDRQLAGTWLGPVPDARDAEDNLVHPLAADLHHEDEAIQRLVSWLTALAGHLHAWRGEAPAAAWADRLARAVDELLASTALDDHVAALRRLLDGLTEVEASTPLDAGTLGDWLEAQLENATSLRTNMGGEILMGRLDQVHGLPCRVLAILGLEDGAFPRAGRRPAWDLLGHDPRPWDQDSRHQDRQRFLEGILAPLDRLILSAANRSLRTPHDGPLSSCVEELLRTAEDTVRLDAAPAGLAAHLVTHHRIQPFAAEYFGAGGTPPASYDANAARIAADLARPRHEPPSPFFSGTAVPAPATDDEARTLPLSRLVSFWGDPARAWLQALQVEVPEDEDDDTELDDAPVTLSALQAYAVREEALQARLPASPTDPYTTGHRLSADRTLPPGALGELAWERFDREMADLAEGLAPLLRDAAPIALDLSVDPRLRLTGEVLVADSPAAVPRVIVYRPGRYDKHPRQQLGAFIQVIAAAAQLARPTAAVVLGLDLHPPRELPALDPAEARALLAQLVDGYRQGQLRPLCFAPQTSTDLLPPLTGRGEEVDRLDKARATWSNEGFLDQPGGEGTKPAARLAWRDVDPFAPPFAAEWQAWAAALAAPLRAWWTGRPSAAPAPAPAPPPRRKKGGA